ncbi:flagellar motor switch protein FliM [Leptospira interrogans serovar Australis str. 200703203]|uniref:Flagellar motor switch protein FliM n=1 Tax=Leptospira interrogans serovar Australis str. 200703203 TaxID=1085541 RepID=N1UPQ9_LEPIR|nr:flagellar motor switch protein FliM [Leptospira interrogans serovar Australis str. 200703203]
MMHETFARLATTGLSAQLRALVSVHVASVDQLTYEEFIRSIPNPTTLAVINMDPLRGSAILEIDPSISFTIIDRLFGGKGEQAKISRELSEIEMSVMEGIIVRILGNMRESWSTVIDLRPRLGNIETNPQFAQVVPPNDMVVLITLETKIGEVEGMTNLCIPYITIEPIINKLSAQYWYSSIRKENWMKTAP